MMLSRWLRLDGRCLGVRRFPGGGRRRSGAGAHAAATGCAARRRRRAGRSGLYGTLGLVLGAAAGLGGGGGAGRPARAAAPRSARPDWRMAAGHPGGRRRGGGAGRPGRRRLTRLRSRDAQPARWPPSPPPASTLLAVPPGGGGGAGLSGGRPWPLASGCRALGAAGPDGPGAGGLAGAGRGRRGVLALSRADWRVLDLGPAQGARPGARAGRGALGCSGTAGRARRLLGGGCW